ncbi:MAG: HAMP domain-containing sensor histidine kinase [Candidatus Pacebacteria bacterium]|nr:HAMP domain-containing sensor histidine kinase [Candidatus Paceibacterota bacterium]
MQEVVSQLNIVKYCRGYGLSIWQCPQFLFLVMGLIIILTSIGSYLIGSSYITDPSLVALIVIIITGVLFIISYIITRSFERLAEASRMKSEFINIVSHQLRSPITNIKWIADFLTSEDVEIADNKKDEYYTHLKENISRMVELIDDLLIVSKIEEGSFPLKKTKSSLNDLVYEVIERSKAFAEVCNIKIVFNPKESLPSAFFDPNLIKLVVENLIDNAIRYTKKGGRVEIETECRKNRLYFSIKDNGVGIPKQDQKYIFGKFFRAENAMRNQTKGSGLGLYIAKSIIIKSGGRIWFDSEANKGTTFHFLIPTK